MAIAQTTNRLVSNAVNTSTLLSQRRLPEVKNPRGSEANANPSPTGAGEGGQVKKELVSNAPRTLDAAKAGGSPAASIAFTQSTVSLSQNGKSSAPSEAQKARFASVFNDGPTLQKSSPLQPASNAASAQAAAAYADVGNLSLSSALESSRKEVEAQQKQLAEKEQSSLQEMRATMANGAAYAAQFAPKLF